MTDTLTTEIIGFRQWRVGENLELRSGHVDDHWKVGENTATCKGKPDPASAVWGYSYGPSVNSECKDCPGNGCHCGFYALHVPSFWYGKDADKQQAMMRMMIYGGEEIFVGGLVAAWGKTQVHHDGFRAQHAKVVALAIPDRKRDAALARACAAEYGVPTVPQAELERVAGEFGSLVPEDLRPAKVNPADEMFRVYANAVVYGSSHVQPPQHYWGTSNAASIRAWMLGSCQAPIEPPKAAKSKSKHQKIADEIAQMKSHTYDPRAFQPKRRGGLR